MTYRELTRAIERKVPGPPRAGGHERNRWAVLGGRKILRVTFPKVQRGDVPPGSLNSIRKQLRLDRPQFEGFVDCTVTGPEYERHLRGLVESGAL